MQAQQRVAVRLLAEPGDCSVALDGASTQPPARGCETAKRLLSDRAVRYTTGRCERRRDDQPSMANASRSRGNDEDALVRQRVERALDAAGYPRQADPARIDHARVIAILFVLVVFVAMVYGPIAAHAGRDVPDARALLVGEPAVPPGQWLVRRPVAECGAGDLGAQRPLHAGLWLPIVVTLGSAVIGLVLLRDTKGTAL